MQERDGGVSPCGTVPARILIVDDNSDLVSTLKAVLAPQGAVVETASRGDEALRAARELGFEVALVDVKLPDVSGTDLIEPLRDAGVGEVVLITGNASIDAALAALQKGAFAFVLKSFRPEELISTVRQAITKVRLQQSREDLGRKYRALAELTDVVVVGLDPEGLVAFFNRRAGEIVHVDPTAARGRDFSATWIPDADRERLHAALASVRASEAMQEVETGFTDPNERGPVRRIRWHFSPARDGGAGPRDVVFGLGIDVTEKRTLERRATDAEALSAMGSLALNLAHEIRNPLNAAVLQLHLLKRDIEKAGVDEERRKSMHRRIDVVESEVGRLSRLLTEFLELARPRQLVRDPVAVEKLVDEVFELQREAAEARGVDLVRRFEAGDASVAGDAEKLKQVVLNVVVNGIEAMREGGTLEGRVAVDGGSVVVTLADTGPGIGPDVLANVFDPFFTTKEAGTGLGLAIVRKIVEQHGGTVAIESELGRGTQVVLRLPLR